jgi:phosphoglycolate phosphatase
MNHAENLFFDLDGTLTDPKEGITKSIAYALEKMGHRAPPLDELARFIGPPLYQCFTEILGADKAEAAIKHYRHRYSDEGKGITENILYPDIPPVLERLKQEGKKLFIVTSKPRPIAEKIVRHFGLNLFFNFVCGPELHQHVDKDVLIAAMLEREKAEARSVVMIGDRKYDITGAAKNNIRSIGVCWGYGSVEELQTAGATAIAQKPSDLLEILI